MPNRISLLVALEGADEGLKRAISSAERSFNEMSAAAKTAGAKAAQGMAELKAGTAALGDQLTRARTQLLAFVGVSWATQQITQLVQVADQWNLMVARLKLATAGQREFVIAQSELFAIAQRIGVPLAEVSTLYGKLQQAVRQLGGEQKTALSLTESISQALKISGASASEAQSSLLQFGQALASGVLRGEEFNSVVENSPRLAQALADGLNVPIGRLRKLAEQGQLTADVVVNALMSQKDKLAAEYAQLPVTVGTAFERLKNAFAQWIAKVDESTGITQKLATALDWLARNFETVMGWLKVIAEIGLAVLIYRLIPALITAWQLAGTAAVTAAASTSAAWTTANLSLSAAVATAGLLKASFAVLAAALIGWEIGTWLSEKFEVVRMAGIAMVQVLEDGMETLKFSWERFAAIFTGDTIAAATQRHEERLRQMNAIFAEMYVDASEAGRAAQQAAALATASAEEMARRLEAVRQGTQEAVGRGIEAIDATLNKLKSQITAIEQVVTVNYARGQVAMATSAPNYAGNKTITFRPAAAPIRVADTAGVRVDIENRAYNYVLTILPSPAPGTLQVSYRAQGKWYDLRDNSAGVLKGSSPEYGVGTVNYSSGTVAVTVGALPDVGSEIVYAWGGKANYFNRSDQTIAPTAVTLELAQAGITPQSVTITWNDGAPRTATDDGAGRITGAATGTIHYQSGLIQLTPAVLPAGGQTYSVAYTWGPPTEEEFHAPMRDGTGRIDVEVEFDGLIPGTVELEWNLLIETFDYISTTPAELQLVRPVDPIKIVRDDRNGNLKDTQGVVYGTVNYATGVLRFLPDTTVRIPVARYLVTQIGLTRLADGTLVPVYRNVFSHWEYITAGAAMPIDDSAWAKVRYRAAGTSNSVTQPFTASGLALDLTPSFAEPIVPGSVGFTLGGKTYFDRLGSLYYDLNPVNGAATLAGAINYATGAVTLTAWMPAQSPTVALRSLLTSLDGTPVDEVTFRIPASPVRPSSLQLLATRLTGGTINVSADNHGIIAGAGITGAIDYETGVVRARFGSWVLAAGNEDEIWFDPGGVVVLDGVPKVFKPAPVFADTIKYNAVAYSYLPLDADLIGLDPVRLPQDGRVPIFRMGDFAVIGHTETVGPFTASAGQVVDCDRVRLSRVRVLDANGVVITTGYTVDLEAGLVTFTSVTGLAQPVTVEHRIEDMAQVSDVQISGRLAFTRQITHDYPTGSRISSALVSGDLRAYVSTLFDQATWNGAFTDALTGNAATATFNDVLAPITVTNAGAITERWAVQFTNTTAFQVIGEHVGVIATGTTANDLAPINPATAKPYFTLRALGWGSGWAAGNVLRFNTIGALFPVWVVRTIQQGPETVTRDAFTLLVRGDVDRP